MRHNPTKKAARAAALEARLAAESAAFVAEMGPGMRARRAARTAAQVGQAPDERFSPGPYFPGEPRPKLRSPFRRRSMRRLYQRARVSNPEYAPEGEWDA